jgi:hypothetical protein
MDAVDIGETFHFCNGSPQCSWKHTLRSCMVCYAQFCEMPISLPTIEFAIWVTHRSIEMEQKKMCELFGKEIEKSHVTWSVQNTRARVYLLSEQSIQVNALSLSFQLSLHQTRYQTHNLFSNLSFLSTTTIMKGVVLVSSDERLHLDEEPTSHDIEDEAVVNGKFRQYRRVPSCPSSIFIIQLLVIIYIHCSHELMTTIVTSTRFRIVDTESFKICLIAETGQTT